MKSKITLIVRVIVAVLGLLTMYSLLKPKVDNVKGNPEVESAMFLKLVELHEVKRLPGPHDWLAQHHEPGQTVEQYEKSNPRKPNRETEFIYVTLIGDFDEARQSIIDKTVKFIEAFYGMKVKFTAPVSLSSIPEEARRTHPQTGDKQVLSTYIIEDVLVPIVPDDAYSLIAFTTSDLWPGEGWNFVFGQASIEDRVGVWSIYRNGDPSKDLTDYQLCLRRTIKTGVHELGHMFGMHHCIYYECLINGSNHRQESDSQPVWLCPVCLNKLHYVTQMDLAARYSKLQKLCNMLGLYREAVFYKRALEMLM